jgi:hypothetical protein
MYSINGENASEKLARSHWFSNVLAFLTGLEMRLKYDYRISSSMKVKIGTQLDDKVLRKLKVAAAQERRPMGEIVQAAVVEYLQRKKQSSQLGSGLRRFLEAPDFTLSSEQFRQSMEADFYDQ